MKTEVKSRDRITDGRWVIIPFQRVAGGAMYPPDLYEGGDFKHFISPQRVEEEVCTVEVPGPRSQWKPFQHYKMVLAEVQGSGMAWDTTYWKADLNDWSYGHRGIVPTVLFGVRLNSGLRMYEPREGVVSWRDSIITDPGFVPLPADLELLQQRALSAIMPRIKSEFSVLNAVYELKDFKHLALTAKSAIVRVSRLGLDKVLLSTLRKVGKAFTTRPTLSGLARTAAGTYLEWKFAIAPLLQDIAATWQAVSNTEKKLRKLLDNAEKVRIGHFSWEYVEYTDVTITGSPYVWSALQPASPDYNRPLGSCSGQVVRDVGYKPSKFHQEIEYSYYYLDLQIAHSRLLAYLDAFGIQLNPAIIWNAIPFTFILDWVVGVSRFLDSLKAGWMDPVVIIHQCLWSITRERRISGRVKYSEFGGYATNGHWYSLPECTETAYRREVIMPSKSSLLTMSGLSATELSLGTALLVSRRARRKRRL